MTRQRHQRAEEQVPVTAQSRGGFIGVCRRLHGSGLPVTAQPKGGLTHQCPRPDADAIPVTAQSRGGLTLHRAACSHDARTCEIQLLLTQQQIRDVPAAQQRHQQRIQPDKPTPDDGRCQTCPQREWCHRGIVQHRVEFPGCLCPSWSASRAQYGLFGKATGSPSIDSASTIWRNCGFIERARAADWVFPDRAPHTAGRTLLESVGTPRGFRMGGAEVLDVLNSELVIW